MKIIKPDSLDNFLSYFGKLYNSGDCYYRGQTNSEWKIIPGLGRNKDTDVQKQIIKIECRLYNKFWRELCFRKLIKLIPLNHHDYHFTWQWLMAFQHYGLPTRLIDFSSDKFIALRFAITEIEYLDKDSAFFIYVNPGKVFEGTDSSILSNPFTELNRSFFFQVPIYGKSQKNEDFLSERRKFMQGSKFLYRATSELTECLSLNREHTNSLVKIIIRKEFKLKLIDFLISKGEFNYDIYRGRNAIDYFAPIMKIDFLKLNKKNLSEFLKK